jgi:hypothetical protein
VLFEGFFPCSLTSTLHILWLVIWHHYWHYTYCGRKSSNNVAIICSYDHDMEIFLIKFGYHNEHHVENLAFIFSIYTPI